MFFFLINSIPRDPITLSEDDWGVQSPPKRKVFFCSIPIISFGEPGSLGYVHLCTEFAGNPGAWYRKKVPQDLVTVT